MSQIPMTPQLAGMPQGGAPMMPPQMRQEQQQVGIANTGDLSRLPDQQLAQMANSPGNAMMQLAALSEVQKRQQARRAAQAQQAQRGMGQGTVKDQVLRGAGLPSQQATPPNPIDAVNAQPQAHGLPGLPTGQAIPQQYARGGVVGFNGEEESRVPGPAPGINQTPGSGQRIATAMPSWGIPSLIMKKFIPPVRATPPSEIPGMVANLPPVRAMMEADRITGGGAPEAAAASGAVPTNPAWENTYGKMSYRPAEDDSGGAASGPNTQGGVAALMSGVGGGGRRVPYGRPEWIDPRAGAREGYFTDEERDAQIKAEYARLKALYGEDVAQQYLKEIQAERKGMDKKYEDNKYEALSRAGLAMMAGKSKHWAVNVGEGGIAGLNAFQAGRKDLDSQAAQLRREEMQAALASQQYNNQIVSGAIGQTDKREAQRLAQRQEDMSAIQNWNTFRMDAAKLDIEADKAGAAWAQVGAHLQQVAATYGLAHDDRIAKLITETQVKALAQLEKQAEGDMALKKRISTSQGLANELLPLAQAMFMQNIALTKQAGGSGIRTGGAGARVNVSGLNWGQ